MRPVATVHENLGDLLARARQEPTSLEERLAAQERPTVRVPSYPAIPRVVVTRLEGLDAETAYQLAMDDVVAWLKGRGQPITAERLINARKTGQVGRNR